MRIGVLSSSFFNYYNRNIFKSLMLAIGIGFGTIVNDIFFTLFFSRYSKSSPTKMRGNFHTKKEAKQLVGLASSRIINMAIVPISQQVKIFFSEKKERQRV